MQKDIKKLFENYNEGEANLSPNHRKEFENKLFQELHSEKKPWISYKWLSIAASLILLMSVAIRFLPSKDTPIINSSKKNTNTNTISLGSISPDLKTIETYYINSINLELSELEITDDNKELLDSYITKLGELTKEYKSLTEELNTKGVNDETIDALISNLQLRLQLLKRLKKKLNTLKQLNTQNNEVQIL